MNFIEEKITKRGKENLIFRFPPNPNFHIHLGHAKSICLNFELAKKFNGKCNLRFDDTNPSVEKTEFVESIIKDIEWLGYKPDNIFFASDYFDFIYECAITLIKKGLAYVDDSTSEEIAKLKGTPTTHGIDSPYKKRSVEENLSLFNDMRMGVYPSGSKTLRANIDMKSPNMFLRDPIIYRMIETPHHRTGDKWKIYPMYDFAHPLSDWKENITDSLCSNEFEIHKPLYMWVLENCELELPYPDESEFSRLNLENVSLSKRHLKKMVENGVVDGWDDPRIPTISGIRKKGYTPESIRDFCDKISVTRRESVIPYSLLEDSLRDDLNKRARRIMGVFNPLLISVKNLDSGHCDIEDIGGEVKKVHFTKNLFIEKEDFMENPSKDFFRLSVGKCVRLKGLGIIRADEVIKIGNDIVEVVCSLVEGEKVRATIHWVSTSEYTEKKLISYHGLEKTEKKVLFEKNMENIGIGENVQIMRHGYAVNWEDCIIFTTELKR
ncbi:glutamine--tRNA ligase [bacterium]|nr:glutamine--tRNA ligase [bacterium]